MKVSQCFLQKEDPANTKTISHKLMLRSSMIMQTASGIYSWLPVGIKVLQKVQNIIREELNKTGALELEMPTLQPEKLWQESGRYEDYGLEMLRATDRHGRELIYGPTAEEVVTDIARNFIKSYKQLPVTFYQIQTKFRDEIRPRFGVMRAREFCMKDAYSFCMSDEEAKFEYMNIYKSYLEIFPRVGVLAIPVKADTGPIGGNLSHEFQVLAQDGESRVYYDKKLNDLLISNPSKEDVIAMLDLYAMADDMHDESEVKNIELCQSPAIEVGHIFNLGDKYSRSMNFSIVNSKNDQTYPLMGCYGIGVSRLVAAIIESNHDENGIIWPISVAPFTVIIINISPKEEQVCDIANNFYKDLCKQKIDVLIDDENTSIGVKFSKADLLGVPIQIIIGKNSVKNGNLELRYRKDKKSEFLSYKEANLRIINDLDI